MWVLETERLTLRQFTSADVDNLLQIFGDPEAMRFYPAPFTARRLRAGFAGAWIAVRKTALGYGRWCAKKMICFWATAA